MPEKIWDEKRRYEWVAAGYSAKGGSVCILPPPKPDVLRVYHLTAESHAISNLALGRMKVARFSDLNDPFELMALNLREGRDRSIIRNFKNSVHSETGLLCFSANWTNPVLWSHYANKHHGICLGFDLKRTMDPKYVKYEPERIKAATLQTGELNDLTPDVQQALLCTKFDHWRYEEEVRVFVRLSDMALEGNLHFFPFGPNLELKEVILGTQCSVSLESIRELVSAKYPEAITFGSRLANKAFSVVPRERSLPGAKPLNEPEVDHINFFVTSSCSSQI